MPAKINGKTAMEAKPSTITGPVMLFPNHVCFYGVRTEVTQNLVFARFRDQTRLSSFGLNFIHEIADEFVDRKVRNLCSSS